MEGLPTPPPGVRYRVIRYTDILDPEVTDPTKAAVEGYTDMMAADMGGELPIVEVIDLMTGEKVDVDLVDHVDAVEGGAL